MKTQVAIIGGGPAGTSLAIQLTKSGIDCVIIEKEQFPRFHIGESMTGECGASVRALGIETKMQDKKFPIKWGTVVYGANGKNKYHIPVMRRNDDGMLEAQNTWQVKRSDFDKMLIDSARENGVTTIDGQVLDVIREGTEIRGIKIQINGKEENLLANIIADCSGQNTFLAGRGVTSKKLRGKYYNQTAVFSHFKNCIRPTQGDEGDLMADDTLIFYSKKHYWAWFIPIDNEIVSVGIVTPSDYFKSKKESKHDYLLREMHSMHTLLSERVKNAEMVQDAHACSSFSYHIKEFTGKNWLCVGDSHRFIDPIFSLGLHFAMAEGRKAASAIEKYFKDELVNKDNPFIDFQTECEGGMDIIQEMIDAFWDYPLAFSLYTRHKKYRDDFIDMFAGRVYNVDTPNVLLALRELNNQPSTV